MSDTRERCTERLISKTFNAETASMESFVTRFHAVCAEKGVDGERLHELTCANIGRKVRSLGRTLDGAHNPNGRDLRHMTTHGSAKSGKVNRARASVDSHASGIDRHVRQGKYMCVLEREFCSSKDRYYKRSLRQIARLMARDTAVILPAVFGGTMWYDSTLIR